MTVYELIKKRRSIRRFRQKRISFSSLRQLVDSARVAPSSANLQPLEYVIVDRKDMIEKVFPMLYWAAYISPYGIPPEGERPTAYIVVLVNKRIRLENYEWDIGAAVENIILAALEKDIGSCWIQSIERQNLSKVLGIPDFYYLDTVVALGYKAEDPLIEEMSHSIKYWLDDSHRLHVPKRRLDDILHRNIF